MKQIYDIFTKKLIDFEIGKITEKALEMGLKPHTIHGIWNETNIHLKHRYILPKNIDKIFTLVDIDTKQEYDCIANGSIFIHFNKKINKSEAKYVYELKRKRQYVASICGRVFYLKSNPPIKIQQRIKNKSLEVNKIKKKMFNDRKLANRIRACIRAWINERNVKKLSKTEKLIGCTLQFYIGYLEAQFSSNMTWENYGEWHIDHIIPCKNFDLNVLENQYKCFHYKNTRPLWATTEIAIKYGESSDYIGNLNRNKKSSSLSVPADLQDNFA